MADADGNGIDDITGKKIVPNGAAQDDINPYVTGAPASGANTNGNAPWNADTRPIIIAHTPAYTSGVSHTPDTVDRAPIPNLTNVYQAQGLLSYWRSQAASGDRTYSRIIDAMRSAGYLGERANSLTSIEAAWGAVLEDGANLYANGPSSQADTLDYLFGMAAQGADQPTTHGGSGSGGGPSSAINLTDPGTARVLVDQALQQYLGRTATDKEAEAFRKALAHQEMANPRTATVQGDTAIQSGGFNPQQFAQDFARGQDGAAEYQAATTFLDAFIGSLRNPNEVL